MQHEGYATAQHFAMQHDDMDIATSLLSEGANINVPHIT